MPVVSVVIPVWNRANIVSRAIDSALSQALPAGMSMQILVVDDGSSDDLATRVQAFGNRVSVVRHETNRGAAAARNTGVAAATGGYVAFLDSDDTWLDGKLVAQLTAMQTHGWVASCTAYRLCHPGRPEVISPRYRTGALGLGDLVWGCYVSPGSTLMFRRSVFDEIGPIDISLKRLEDWDWLLRYVAKYPLGFLAEPLARIEPHANPNGPAILAALDSMRAKYLNTLSGRDRQSFLAGVDVETAAVYYRQGHFALAARRLMASLIRVPIGNDALMAVFSNRRRRV